MNKAPWVLVGILMFASSTVFAASQLSSLKGEWKGKCRPFANEGEGQVKQAPFQSLRNSYEFKAPRTLVWIVTGYKDDKCAQFYDANRYTFQCEAKAKTKGDNCTQTKWEHAQEA